MPPLFLQSHPEFVMHFSLSVVSSGLVGHAIAGKQDLYRACAQENVGLVAMKPFEGRLFQE